MRVPNLCQWLRCNKSWRGPGRSGSPGRAPRLPPPPTPPVPPHPEGLYPSCPTAARVGNPAPPAGAAGRGVAALDPGRGVLAGERAGAAGQLRGAREEKEPGFLEEAAAWGLGRRWSLGRAEWLRCAQRGRERESTLSPSLCSQARISKRSWPGFQEKPERTVGAHGSVQD